MDREEEDGLSNLWAKREFYWSNRIIKGKFLAVSDRAYVPLEEYGIPREDVLPIVILACFPIEDTPKWVLKQIEEKHA